MSGRCVTLYEHGKLSGQVCATVGNHQHETKRRERKMRERKMSGVPTQPSGKLNPKRLLTGRMRKEASYILHNLHHDSRTSPEFTSGQRKLQEMF